jgi:GNAT superfamily N-acetyltransferase
VLDISPFSDEHLDAAAELLAARHRRHRQAEPLLPVRYEDPVEGRAAIEALLATDGAGGVVALDGDRVTGYLVGTRLGELWGPNAWVEAAGHAADEPETVRDLYAAAAAGWVEDGRTTHFAAVPASDAALVDAWFRLAFGLQHVQAVREVPEDTPWPDGVRATEERDVDELLQLVPVLPEHQRRSPTFAFGAPSPDGAENELRREILEEISDDDVGSFVVERDGRVAGNLLVVPLDRSTMYAGPAKPEGIAFLGYAATAPDARGTGAGVALTAAAFAWARERGFPAMATDWRATNLLASRFWPRRGFRPTFLRLHRLVGY